MATFLVTKPVGLTVPDAATVRKPQRLPRPATDDAHWNADDAPTSASLVLPATARTVGPSASGIHESADDAAHETGTLHAETHGSHGPRGPSTATESTAVASAAGISINIALVPCLLPNDYCKYYIFRLKILSLIIFM